MRFSLASSVVVALAAQSAVASNWFNKAGAYCESLTQSSPPSICSGLLLMPHAVVYNKWHDTELDRWLSDYNIPHPTPVDRKDLENLVKTHWNDKVVYPYQSWDASQLQAYLTLKGQEAKRDTEKNKDSLLDQVKEYWTETDESAHQAYGNVRDWIFDRYVGVLALSTKLMPAAGPTRSSRRSVITTAFLCPSPALATHSSKPSARTTRRLPTTSRRRPSTLVTGCTSHGLIRI